MKQLIVPVYRLLYALSLLLLLGVISAGAQTPEDDLWRDFAEWNPGRKTLPEDQVMGVLADRRIPDPSWSGALAVCDRVFQSMKEGQLPLDEFHPGLRLPLSRAFEKALNGGGKNLRVRYGLPERTGDRVAVKVRADDDATTGYGYIYLVRLDGDWFVEQWALDLTPFAAESPSG